MKTTLKAQVKEIGKVVSSERLVANRIAKLIKLGYEVNEYAMGSGGVMQIKQLENETRVQIGYGHGKHNYAFAVSLKK